MDFEDPNKPQIKDLPVYLESTKKKTEKRTELENQDFFYQAKTPAMGDSQPNQKGASSIDNGDMFSSYGPSYK